MMTPLIDYTISSYDYNHYNRIDINLPSPPSRRVSMIVTSLTTKCSIVVIENDDYIQINGKKYVFNNMYTDLNSVFHELFIFYERICIHNEYEFTNLKKFSKGFFSFNCIQSEKVGIKMNF